MAVAAGMAMITRAAAAKGLCGPETVETLEAALRQYGLPTGTDYPCARLAKAVAADKKRSGGSMNLVVPESIGTCRICRVAMEEIPDWLRLGGAR